MHFHDEQQLNQINKALEEGNEYIKSLSPDLDISIFRKFRELFKKHVLNDKDLQTIVNAANAYIDITKITDEMLKGDISLALEIVSQYDDETIKKFYEEEMNDEKRKFIKFYMPQKNLLDYRKYDKEILTIIKDNDFDKYKENIVNNNYNEKQMLFLAEAINKDNIHPEMMSDEYPVEKMKLIRSFIEKKLDLEVLESYLEDEINIYNKMIEENIDISQFYKKVYEPFKLYFIMDCAKREINPDDHMKILDELDLAPRSCYMELIRGQFTKNSIDVFLENYEKLVENNTIIQISRMIGDFAYSHRRDELDVTTFFNPDYRLSQLDVINKAFRHGIDLGKYCSAQFDAFQMEFIFDLIKNEIDISTILNPDYTVEDMRRISFYNNKGIFFDTIEEYYENYTRDKNLDYKSFIQISNQTSGFTNDNTVFILINSMVKLNSQNEYQINIEQMLEAKAYYSIEQFFTDLNDGLDVNKIWNPKYNSSQRTEIRKGLISGIDVDKYADYKIPAKEMEEIREKLESEISLDDKIKNVSSKMKIKTPQEEKER